MAAPAWSGYGQLEESADPLMLLITHNHLGAQVWLGRGGGCQTPPFRSGLKGGHGCWEKVGGGVGEKEDEQLEADSQLRTDSEC